MTYMGWKRAVEISRAAREAIAREKAGESVTAIRADLRKRLGLLNTRLEYEHCVRARANAVLEAVLEAREAREARKR